MCHTPSPLKSNKRMKSGFLWLYESSIFLIPFYSSISVMTVINQLAPTHSVPPASATNPRFGKALNSPKRILFLRRGDSLEQDTVGRGYATRLTKRDSCYEFSGEMKNSWTRVARSSYAKSIYNSV